MNKRVAAFFVLLLVSLTLAYANTLYSPFNFDDQVVIKSEIAGSSAQFFKFYPPRYRHLFYLSLVFNHSWGGLDPFGYHLFNISLHFLTSIAVFFIALVTIERGTSWGRSAAGAIAAITALAFALNPVHSETVNYISARAVGLGGLFYFSALLLFILGSFRERGGVSRILFYAGSLICFVASVLSKETGLTFPAAVLLYDFCFMRRDGWTSFKNRFLLFYLPFLACGAFAVLTILTMKTMILDWWGKIDFSYALKQARIVGHGIHLLLFPIGLTFDYDFPDGFFPHPALRAWPILLLVGLVLLAARYLRGAAAMISFCVFWYLLTLAPTNSILPRTDLLNERNLYLPSFGILFLAASGAYHLVLTEQRRPALRRIGVGCLAGFFMFHTVLLLERNALYQSNILLWEDTVKKAPGKLRALHNLSHFYLVEKNYRKAFASLQSLANSKASPYYTSYAYSNLGALHIQFGNYPKAEAAFKEGIRIKPSLPTNHLNLGAVYASQGRYMEAKDAYEKAESLYDNYRWGYQAPSELYLDKARVLLTIGIYKEAERSAVYYLQRIPDSGPGHFLLGKIYAAMGKEEEAIREYELSGDDPKLRAEAHNNTAIIFIKRDQADRALEELKQAVALSPGLLDAHYNLGRLLAATGGDMGKARSHLETALKLSPNLESRKRVQQALNNLP